MTLVKLLLDEKSPCGFEISGHSSDNCDDLEGKLVCSAVSSAAYLAANTIIEIVGDNCEAEVEDGFMRILVTNPCKTSISVLEGFKLHITELSKQYNKRIRIITEV